MVLKGAAVSHERGATVSALACRDAGAAAAHAEMTFLSSPMCRLNSHLGVLPGLRLALAHEWTHDTLDPGGAEYHARRMGPGNNQQQQPKSKITPTEIAGAEATAFCADARLRDSL